MVKVVQKYLDDHPEKLAESAAELVGGSHAQGVPLQLIYSRLAGPLRWCLRERKQKLCLAGVRAEGSRGPAVEVPGRMWDALLPELVDLEPRCD